MDLQNEFKEMITEKHLGAIEVCCVACKACKEKPSAIGVVLYCYYLECSCETPAEGFMASDFFDCLSHWNWCNGEDLEGQEAEVNEKRSELIKGFAALLIILVLVVVAGTVSSLYL